MKLSVLCVVHHDADVDAHVEFASDAVVHEIDAHVVVTYDVTVNSWECARAR